MDPTVASALLTGVIGLLGTGIGGGIAYATFRKQLQHQKEENERARTLGFRREVYLELLEAVGAAQLFLGSFSRADVAPLQLADQLHSVPGAMAKAQLVATEETFDSLEAYGDFFSSRVAKLFKLRVRMEDVRREIRLQEQEIAGLVELYSHTRFAAEQAPEPLVMRQHLSEMTSIQLRLEQARARLKKLADHNVTVTKTLGREAYQATLEAQKEAGRVAIRLRRELDLPLDEESYLNRLDKRIGALMPRIEDMFEDVDEVIAETESL